MKKSSLLLGAVLILSGCGEKVMPANETPAKSNLTSGQVSLTLKKNQTTQAEVLEVFGAPNLVTSNADGEEVWSYQKHATVANASSATGVAGFGGLGLATILLGGIGGTASTSSSEQSSRTMTLIIKFREVQGTKRVVDFSSRYSSF